jgi:hypothetical protein
VPARGGEEGVRVAAMESEVGCNDLSGGAPDHGMFVGALQLWLCGETLALSVRIDEPPPAGEMKPTTIPANPRHP